MADKGGVGREFGGEPWWRGRGRPCVGEEGTLLELLSEVTANGAVCRWWPMLMVEPYGLEDGIHATVALRAFSLNARERGHWRSGGLGKGPAFGKDGFWNVGVGLGVGAGAGGGAGVGGVGTGAEGDEGRAVDGTDGGLVGRKRMVLEEKDVVAGDGRGEAVAACDGGNGVGMEEMAEEVDGIDPVVAAVAGAEFGMEGDVT